MTTDLLADLGLTTTALAMIEAAADEVAEAKAAGKPGKAKARKSTVVSMMERAKAGEFPTMPEFPASNAYAHRHAATMRDAAQALNAGAVAGYQIGGTNTYSKMLRGYQAALLAYLEVKASEPDTSDIQEVTEEMMAKGRTVNFAAKMKAAKAKKAAAQAA